MRSMMCVISSVGSGKLLIWSEEGGGDALVVVGGRGREATARVTSASAEALEETLEFSRSSETCSSEVRRSYTKSEWRSA